MITYIIIAITAIISIMCFKNRTLFYKLSLSPYAVSHKKEWYRVITHGFVHGSYSHLLINMFVLLSFGSNVERIFESISPVGGMIYVALYIGALIFASIPDINNYKNDYYYNSIGASGAVTAVVFTSIFFNPWSKIYFFAIIPIPAIIFGLLYLWYESYSSRQNQGKINHKAHIYGAIFGILYPILIKPSLVMHFISELMSFNF